VSKLSLSQSSQWWWHNKLEEENINFINSANGSILKTIIWFAIAERFSDVLIGVIPKFIQNNFSRITFINSCITHKLIAITNLSKIYSWNNWHNSRILCEDITVLAIYSNGIDLRNKTHQKKLQMIINTQ